MSYIDQSSMRPEAGVTTAPGGTIQDEHGLDRSNPSSKLLLAVEVREILERQAFFAAHPLLRRTPRGDGHPVLVLPGLLASDVSTAPLPAYLNAQGYVADGRKLGPKQVRGRESRRRWMQDSPVRRSPLDQCIHRKEQRRQHLQHLQPLLLDRAVFAVGHSSAGGDPADESRARTGGDDRALRNER
ncbi:hypothetical protein [Bradyrhizobium oropedii]|uniref:hypothetical protein n=1 Tax=Bradyrhizobium oropedii TaxID=1571201 RepID=UPI003B8461E4